MNSTEKRILFFEKFCELTTWAAEEGIYLLVTAMYRSAAEVKKLYDEGKSELDGYTKVSNHQKWLAIDIVIVKNGVLLWDRNQEYEKLGAKWKEMGGGWGGDWTKLNDVYHFEWRDTLAT